MKVALNPGEHVKLFILRKNGAIEDIFTDEEQAVTVMRSKRGNSQFWRIETRATVPHKETTVTPAAR